MSTTTGAATARRERQRRQMVAAAVAVVVILGAVVAGSVIANRPQTRPTDTGGPAALARLTALPAAVLDAAAAPPADRAPVRLEGGTALTENGKPKVLFVGAEPCPLCAVQRWALIGALSRFGTFRGLTPTTSSSADVHPNTPTFSFHGATYTSEHLVFDGVETQNRTGQPLETLEGENAEVFQRHNPRGTVPWITYGGTHATTGATVRPDAFEAKSYDQIIDGILDPASDLGRTVDPAINVISAQLCRLTKGQPGDVCASPGVVAAAVLLTK